VAALRWRSLQKDLLIIDQSAYAVKGEIGTKSTKSAENASFTWTKPCRTGSRTGGIAAKRTQRIGRRTQFRFIRPFAVPDGSLFVSLDSMSRNVRKVANQLGMKSIHLHSLRHFAATELLAGGISPHDAAEMLGHADPALTLRVYAHASTERQKVAAGILAGALEAPRRTASREVIGFDVLNQIDDTNQPARTVLSAGNLTTLEPFPHCISADSEVLGGGFWRH